MAVSPTATAAGGRRDEQQVEQEEVDDRVDVVPDHAADARAEQEKGRAGALAHGQAAQEAADQRQPAEHLRRR